MFLWVVLGFWGFLVLLDVGKIGIFGFLGDFKRLTKLCRYYIGKPPSPDNQLGNWSYCIFNQKTLCKNKLKHSALTTLRGLPVGYRVRCCQSGRGFRSYVQRGFCGWF